MTKTNCALSLSAPQQRRDTSEVMTSLKDRSANRRTGFHRSDTSLTSRDTFASVIRTSATLDVVWKNVCKWVYVRAYARRVDASTSLPPALRKPPPGFVQGDQGQPQRPLLRSCMTKRCPPIVCVT